MLAIKQEVTQNRKSMTNIKGYSTLLLPTFEEISVHNVKT
jgi:hypothetical protein